MLHNLNLAEKIVIFCKYIAEKNADNKTVTYFDGMKEICCRGFDNRTVTLKLNPDGFLEELMDCWIEG